MGDREASRETNSETGDRETGTEMRDRKTGYRETGRREMWRGGNKEDPQPLKCRVNATLDEGAGRVE